MSAAITSVSTAILDATSNGPPAQCGEESLAASIEELARLRFSIVLTANWEAHGSEDALSRKELRDDLDQLRALYFEKIDRIAMTFGVQQAMDAKDEVERRITVPHSGRPAAYPAGDCETPRHGEFDL